MLFRLEFACVMAQNAKKVAPKGVYGMDRHGDGRMNPASDGLGKPAPDRVKRMEAVMAEHETALLRYATRLVNSPVAAQDVVQNIFIKLYRGGYLESVGAPRLKSWLYRVAHNEAVDHIRREARLRELHERHAGEAPQHVAAEAGEDLSASERHELVLRCLDRMHPRDRQVVLLRLEEGLSYREIADTTGRTTGNVGYILFHAVRKLGELLKKERVFVRAHEPAAGGMEPEET